MIPEVIIKVKPNGQSTVEASNVQGTACSLHTAPFIAALGKQGISLAPGLHADNMGNNRREVARSNHMRTRWLTRRTGRRGRVQRWRPR